MSKKLTALLLALCMVMTMLPTGAFAAEGIPPVPPQQQTQNSGLVQSAGLSWPEEPYSEGLDWTLVGGGNPGRQVYDGAMVLGKGAFEGDTLVVPGEYMQLPVYTIWNNAFESDDHLEQAFLNNGAIENDAFLNCVNLTTVIFGDRVIRIGATAFAGCTSLQYNAYGGALYLGTLDNPYYALIRVENPDISTLTIHPDTRIIADEAFAGCTDLRSITIPEQISYVGQSAFQGCVSLTEVTILSGQIAGSAFADCTALTKVVIAPGVTAFYKDAFLGCTALKGLYISDLAAWCDMYIVNAAANPLYYAGNLYLNGALVQELVIPASVTRIPANAFSGARCVNVISIPSSVGEIESGAFGFMDPWHVLYEGTMEQWDALGYNLSTRMHYRCTGNEGVNAATKSCQLCQNCSHHYVLLSDTSTCTSVGKAGEASYECDRCGHTYTENVAPHDRWLEANCTQPRRCGCGCGKTDGNSLGGHIWQAATCTAPKTCSRCGETEYNPAPHSWDDLDCTVDKICTVCGATQAAGKHYYSDGICLDCPSRCSTGLRYEQRECYYLVDRGDCSDAEIVIPENHDGLIVYEIGAFGNSETITSVTVPATVGKIRDNAFANCTALKKVILPDSIREIGVSAFSGCTSLQTINIPAALKEMPAGMFAGCTGLQNVVIPEGVKTIGGGAFGDCVSLEAITIPDSVTGMGVQTFYRCTGLQEVTIGNGLRTIPEYTFTDCSALQKLTIGDNVETIAFRAFYNCSALKELTIPDSVTQIAIDAFGYCTALTDVHLGSSLQTIGNAAFSYCRALEDLTIPDNVIVIDDAAFLGCESLTKLDLGNGVQRLGVAAFEACRNLAEVILPVSLTSIGDTAFSACYGVEAIFYEGTLAQWEAVTKPEGGHWMPRPDTPVYCLGQCRAYGHAWIEATCTEVKYCPICGTAEGEALGHDYQEEVINPTCEESGYTKKTCSRCNDWFVVEGSWKNPVGHDWQYATCTQPDTCSFCGTTRGEALGHMEYTYDEPPTCTTPGGTVHACYRCDETYLTDEIPALGHTPGSGPNCYASQICEVCKIELQPALGHDWADASCEAPKTCSRCGLTEGAALGHNYQAEVTAPTCIEEGYTTHTCTRCGDSFETDRVPALGHSYENGVCTRCDAEQASEGLEYALSEDGRSYIVIGIGDCEDNDLIIPATYNGLPVAAIAAEAFAYNDYLYSVVIPDSITHIGDSAFTDSWYLERVTFGSGLKVIGERAFYRCGALSTATLPAGVTTIGIRAFYMCSALTGITIPATVETIGDYAFGACSGLTEVIISSGEIGQYAFTSCTKLKNLVLGEGVTRIGADAFGYCSQLLCVTIPAGITQIDNYAFNFCKNLWHVLYTGTQQQWNSISIGRNNDYLTGATLHCEATGNEITDLEGKICGICNCPHDYTVETTQPTCTVDGAKVYTCTLCGHSYTEVLTAPGHSWVEATCETAKTCSVCGATEGGIPGHAWVDATCTAPKTCSRCGITEGDALGHSYEKGVCTRCGERKVSAGLEYKLSTDGSSYTVSGIGSCMDTDIFIPETHNGLPVTAIANFAFNYAEKVTSITLPDSVTQIGTCAFYGCSGLQEINLGTGLIEIQASAFEECSSLTEVVIPDSVQFIGEAAFGGCKNLISVTIGAGVTEMKTCVFRWCEALEKVYFNATAMKDMTNNSQSIFHNAGANGDGITLYIGANVRKIPAFLFNGYNTSLRPKLTGVVFEEGSVCESIGIGAFMRCYELTAITIPDTVICIDDSAFSLCTAMTDITLSKNLATLGESAFSGCSALVTIVIPDGITTVPHGAFQNCISLTSVTLSSITIRIGNSAFWGCSQLESITIPEGVTHIDWAAFYDCTRLGVVYLPQSVTQVGDNAFYNCTDLWHVLYCGTQEQWEEIGIGSNNDALTNAIRHCNSTGDEVTDLEDKKCRICDCVHEYAQERTEPTCTAEGMIVYTCSICGHSFGETIPARGHNWQDATCTEPKTCSVCFATEGEALGHDFVDGYCTRCGVQDDRFSQGLTYKEYNGGYMVTGMGTCNDTHVKIPAQHNGLPVNAIGAQAFATNKSITAVTIPNSVTVIAYGAFNACTGLTEIVIPDSVTAIYGSAFSSCINLRSITLPAGLTVIAKLALSTCYKLETIYFKGTSLQWEAVTKEAYWDDLSGSDVGGYQLICLGNDNCDHAWQDATCTAPKYCPLCGSTAGEAWGHSYKAVVTAPTCVVEGFTTYSCSRCGDSYETDPVPATGKHNYELTAGKEPTCTEAGGATYTCSMCGDSYTQEDIPALGHDYVGGCRIKVEPTINSVGLLVGNCVRCSEPVEAELPALGLKDYTFAVIEAPADSQPGIVRYTWKNTTYGEISIDRPFVYGDVNGDGEVTLQDVLLLRRHLANRDPDTGESSVTVEAGADANGDNIINLQDVLLLRRYLANRDPDTGESTVVLGPQ